MLGALSNAILMGRNGGIRSIGEGHRQGWYAGLSKKDIKRSTRDCHGQPKCIHACTASADTDDNMICEIATALAVPATQAQAPCLSRCSNTLMFSAGQQRGSGHQESAGACFVVHAESALAMALWGRARAGVCGCGPFQRD